MHRLQLRAGGTYRMTLTYDYTAHSGKTTENSDAVSGTFVEMRR